jgi:membrane protein YqaA with SNARE-associated domain
MVYLTLFSLSFLAATLLPLGSEALLIYDVTQGYRPLFLWGVATFGNTLGSMLNYLLGRKGEHYLEKKGYLDSAKIDKAKITFRRYGAWSLLLSWLPIVGDPLTFIAGVLRYPFSLFVGLVFLAKGVRYGVVIYLTLF